MEDLTKITTPFGLLDAETQPPTKPSIDWSHVAPEYKWLARDKDGYAHLYENEPERFPPVWRQNDEFVEANAFASYTPGTCNWKDSLVQRPEGV